MRRVTIKTLYHGTVSQVPVVNQIRQEVDKFVRHSVYEDHGTFLVI